MAGDSSIAGEMNGKAPKPSAIWAAWQFFQGVDPRKLSIPDADLRGKWIIITGGNSGIGRESALQFAKWGANIILGCRPNPPPREPQPDAVVQELQTAAKASGHENTKFEWWECDMSKFSSVETFGKRWLATDRPLDILANNAGIGGGNKGKSKLTVDGFEMLHQVRDFHLYDQIIDANSVTGKLHFTCSIDIGFAAISGTSSGTPDHLHNIQHAILGYFRSHKCQQQNCSISQQQAVLPDLAHRASSTHVEE